MATVTIRSTNSGARPVILQAEPWPGVSRLDHGETIEIGAESETDAPEFEIDEDGETRYLSILDGDSAEFYIVRDGNWLHWTDLPHSGFG